MKRSAFFLLDRYPNVEEPDSGARFVLEHAELAEALGCEAIWLTEHHFDALGAPNPAVLLAAVAARTHRLRLGPAVSVLPYRPPVYVAEDYAMVDAISGGRLNMGVGTGSRPTEFERLGTSFESRRADFETHRNALNDYWSKRALNVTTAQMPPFYVATTAVDSARRIGEAGDSVITLLSPGTPDLNELSRLLEAHREGLVSSGHRPSSAEVVVVMFALVAESDEQALSDASPALGRTLSLLGGSAADADEIARAMQRGSTACFGSETRARQIEDELERAGVEDIAYITRFGGISDETAHGTLRALCGSRVEPMTTQRR